MILRTPERRFSKLPDFSFEPHYIDFNGLHVHYLREGCGLVSKGSYRPPSLRPGNGSANNASICLVIFL
jgi:hypothetical protein